MVRLYLLELKGFEVSTFPFSFEAERKTCELLELGVAAVFGPQNSATADHIRSITDVAEIPFIDTR